MSSQSLYTLLSVEAPVLSPFPPDAPPASIRPVQRPAARRPVLRWHASAKIGHDIAAKLITTRFDTHKGRANAHRLFLLTPSNRVFKDALITQRREGVRKQTAARRVVAAHFLAWAQAASEAKAAKGGASEMQLRRDTLRRRAALAEERRRALRTCFGAWRGACDAERADRAKRALGRPRRAATAATAPSPSPPRRHSVAATGPQRPSLFEPRRPAVRRATAPLVRVSLHGDGDSVGTATKRFGPRGADDLFVALAAPPPLPPAALPPFSPLRRARLVETSYDVDVDDARVGDASNDASLASTSLAASPYHGRAVPPAGPLNGASKMRRPRRHTPRPTWHPGALSVVDDLSKLSKFIAAMGARQDRFTGVAPATPGLKHSPSAETVASLLSSSTVFLDSCKTRVLPVLNKHMFAPTMFAPTMLAPTKRLACTPPTLPSLHATGAVLARAPVHAAGATDAAAPERGGADDVRAVEAPASVDARAVEAPASVP
ncbi:hypothetical protein M885DRAFT_622620 [Pelagophyceae sp. CCMP2097]|nr:hypothetical protein M885DRAFT_622620 [Pelagophyceae sp. CCMP2097]|mmetsp:Transcript_16189/g.56589  ORF Transcript_16189/g.56589 Transcript_16189/m.56589 type:complete len:491 (+) Transcript_16189:108-1580(+)